MDQGDLAMEGSALAPSRRWLTPLRAVLLMLGAVLGGVALSLLLGSPAHAADGDGDGSGTGQITLGSVTSAVSATLTSTVTTTADAVTAVVPAASPIVTPVVVSVVTTVDTTLTAAQQVASPATHDVLSVVQPAAARAFAAVAAVPTIVNTASAHGIVVDSARPLGAGTDGTPSSPILTSSSGAPVAALGVLFAVFALVLLAARRRLDDDALPASPVFETDTSPA